MALPAPILAKTWFTRANIPMPDQSTAALMEKSMVWLLASVLLDLVSTGTTAGSRAANSIWTCIGSSDSSTAGLDGSNRWTSTFTASKLVWAASGVAHSWIVLYNSTLGLYLCLDLVNATATNLGIFFSSTAFTGGSTTTRPTATKEFTCGDAATASPVAGTFSTFIADTSVATAQYAHFSVDESGRFNFAQSRTTAGLFHSFLFLANTTNTHSNDNTPYFAGLDAQAASRGAPTWGGPGGGAGLARSLRIGGRKADDSGNMTTGGPGGILVNNVGGTAAWDAQPVDTRSGVWNSWPIVMYDTSSAGSYYGYRGQLQDLYAVGAPTVGGSYPTTGSPTQHVIGSMLVPLAVVPTI